MTHKSAPLTTTHLDSRSAMGADSPQRGHSHSPDAKDHAEVQAPLMPEFIERGPSALRDTVPMLKHVVVARSRVKHFDLVHVSDHRIPHRVGDHRDSWVGWQLRERFVGDVRGGREWHLLASVL
jgi:hypothetical protein